jgi:hypothetical protein
MIYAEFKKTKVRDNLLNFFCYCEYRMTDFDLDVHNLIIGKKRSSKSTAFLQTLRRKTAFKKGFNKLTDADKYLVDSHYCDKNMIYSEIQDLNDMLKHLQNTIVCSDDAFLLADKRQGMYGTHIKLTQMINVCADNNNDLNTLIQDMTALDQRFANTASTILVVLKRGEGMLFSASNGYGIVKEYVGFEKFTKNPNLLSNYEKAKMSLRRLPSYVCTLRWKQLGDNKKFRDNGHSGNILYDAYLTNKSKWKIEKKDEDSGENEIVREMGKAHTLAGMADAINARMPPKPRRAGYGLPIL